MSMKIDPQTHIGRCRCEECAKKYRPKGKNQDIVFYYVPPQYVPDEPLCSNCIKKGEIKHGGIIISEDARKDGVAVFAMGPGWKLTDEQKKNATEQVSPKVE